MTLGGDKNYDTPGIRSRTAGDEHHPHVAQNITLESVMGSAVWDERTVQHAGYAVSQAGSRKRVEQSFGWMKMIGMLKKVKLARDREGRGGCLPSPELLTTCVDLRNLMTA